MKKLKIALIEPFLTGSHKKWAEGLKDNSFHDITIYGLPGRFWKWRMHGGAISLAKNISDCNYDVFLVSDFLDLALFKSLLNERHSNSKFYVYFHENQLTYPWSPNDKDVKLNRDENYSFINYTSALVSDKIFFNSEFHMNSFVNSLPTFLNKFPDENNTWTINIIKKKCFVLSLALEFPTLSRNISKVENTILWNHRWEYDKNPDSFFKVLLNIKQKGIHFNLIILGEKTAKYPKIFDWAKEFFKNEIIHFGYVNSIKEYWELLQKATILPVTSNQDFFGISIVESMHANVYPILPNRLVYPEHIPKENRGDHLYDTYENLEQKLISILRKPTNITVFHNWVDKYSWQNSIYLYDKMMLFQ